MKQYRSILKTPLMALLIIVGLVSLSFNASAAEKLPFQYEFVKDTGKTFNGFTGTKQMEITFDVAIPSGNELKQVKLYQWDKKTETLGAEVSSIVDSKTITSKKMNVTFKNLEFLNFTDSTKLSYAIVIGKDAKVIPTQTNDYTLPFEIYEVLPGFKSIFVDNSETLINNNIFKHTAPRDVNIHIPKAYLTKIETIHRYEGITTAGPSLTNIDVLTNPETTRMKAWVGPSGYSAADKNSRDLDYREDIKGFSMGQAGLNALCKDTTVPCNGLVDDFNLVAYNKYGMLLTDRSFKVKVNNKEKDFIINDYIGKVDKVFGTTIKLYDLMKDTKLVTAIFEHIPVKDFDDLGVTYALGNTAKVTNDEQLQLALANRDIKTIDLTGYTIANDVVINREVTIQGGIFSRNVVLGDGSKDLNIRLDNIDIRGTLTIDVGAAGTAIINSSNASATTILSGGVSSIYLFDFTSGEILLNNTTPVRIVSSSTTTKDFKIKLNTVNEVTLEGLSGQLIVDVTAGNAAKLTVKNSVGSIVQGLEKGNLSLTISDKVGQPNPVPIEWTVDTLATIIEDGKTVVEKNLTPLEKIIGDWKTTGASLDGLTEYGTTFIVENPDIFGGESVVSLEGINLKITNTPALIPSTQEVVLKGITDTHIYKIKIEVTVSNE